MPRPEDATLVRQPCAPRTHLWHPGPAGSPRSVWLALAAGWQPPPGSGGRGEQRQRFPARGRVPVTELSRAHGPGAHAPPPPRGPPAPPVQHPHSLPQRHPHGHPQTGPLRPQCVPPRGSGGAGAPKHPPPQRDTHKDLSEGVPSVPQPGSPACAPPPPAPAVTPGPAGPPADGTRRDPPGPPAPHRRRAPTSAPSAPPGCRGRKAQRPRPLPLCAAIGGARRRGHAPPAERYGFQRGCPLPRNDVRGAGPEGGGASERTRGRGGGWQRPSGTRCGDRDRAMGTGRARGDRERPWGQGEAMGTGTGGQSHGDEGGDSPWGQAVQPLG